MRTVVWVTIALALSTRAFADPPPTLEQAISKAAQSRKPLVVEFFADWCRPCKYFDAQVLPRADVTAALKNVEFVRYDIDASPGSEISDKLRVSGVPTFLVIDSAGRVTMRRSGMSMSNGHLWFLDLLAHAGRSTQSTTELEAAVAARPNDVNAHLKLASHYRATGRIKDAAEQFGWIVDNASTYRELAAEAASERDAMEQAEARLTAAIASAEKFVDAYPESRLSSFRIVALALSGRVARARIGELAKAHLDAVKPPQWPNAVRAALLASAITIAHDSVQRRLAREPASPSVRLVLAEELLFNGDRAQAEREVKATCRGNVEELWCFLLQQAIDARSEGSPRIERLREFARDYLAALEQPEPHTTDFGLESVGEVDEKFGNAVAAAFRRAHAECAYQTTRGGATTVVLELRQRGRPMRVIVRSREGSELDDCVRRVVLAAELPVSPPALEGHLHGTIVFPSLRASVPVPRSARSSGLMPQVLARFGEIQTYGFRASALADVGGQRTLRWLLGLTAELGAGASKRPAYAGRLTFGIGSRLHSRVSVSIVGGVGVSDLGDKAPRALEIPFEERIRIDVGRVRVHAWLESATIYLADTRQPEDHTAFNLDEYGAGLGMSVAIDRRRVFAAAAYEHRNAGTSAMLLLGIPLGDFY